MAENRVPASGSISLTHTCNFDCIHCYLGRATNSQRRRSEELSTENWLTIIDEITQAGCLFLLFTGGEPLLRNDFAQIYLHAKKNGLIITLFTNGSLISDEIAALFKAFPPHHVEISVYGATPETYRQITGKATALSNVRRGIETLKKHQVNFQLKTIVMKPNRHEFYDIQQMAIDDNVPFRFDAAIFGSFSGDKTPMKYRINPEDAASLEMADDKLATGWKEYCLRMQAVTTPNMLYPCGAGVTNFHIDPFGDLHPCIMPTGVSYNVLQPGGFQHGWHIVLPELKKKKLHGDILACGKCDKRFVCTYCPAFFALETGSEMQRSSYLCAQAQARYEKLFPNQR